MCAIKYHKRQTHTRVFEASRRGKGWRWWRNCLNSAPSVKESMNNWLQSPDKNGMENEREAEDGGCFVLPPNSSFVSRRKKSVRGESGRGERDNTRVSFSKISRRRNSDLRTSSSSARDPRANQRKGDLKPEKCRLIRQRTP